MKRGKLLVTILTMMFCFAGSVYAEGNKEAGSSEDKVYEFKLGHIQPIEHPNGQGAEEFARLVEEKTDGRVKIKVFPASQLGNEKDIYDSMTIGVIDFAILGYGEPAKRYKPALIFDAPFLAKDREHLIRIFNSSLVQGMFDEMAEVTGVEAIGPIYYGSRFLTTSKKAVRVPADLNGMKIRVPDMEMYVNTLKYMGASPVPIAFPEVYLSLQQGTIDGQENPPATIATNKFYEVQDYITTTGHIMGGNCFYANSASLDKLPADLKAKVFEAAVEAADWTNAVAFEAEDKNLKVIEDNGVEVIRDPDVDAFMDAVKPLYEAYEKDWGVGLMDKMRAID